MANSLLYTLAFLDDKGHVNREQEVYLNGLTSSPTLAQFSVREVTVHALRNKGGFRVVLPNLDTLVIEGNEVKRIDGELVGTLEELSNSKDDTLKLLANQFLKARS